MTKLKGLFTASFVAGCVLAAAPAADASYRSYQASGCASSTTSAVVSTTGWTATTANAQIYCPILDDNPGATFSASTGLNVDVYDGSTTAGVTVGACVTFAGSVGSSCTTTATGTAFTGNTTVSPALSSWTTYPNDYAYVWVVLPAVGGGGNSNLRGYYQTF